MPYKKIFVLRSQFKPRQFIQLEIRPFQGKPFLVMVSCVDCRRQYFCILCSPDIIYSVACEKCFFRRDIKFPAYYSQSPGLVP